MKDLLRLALLVAVVVLAVVVVWQGQRISRLREQTDDLYTQLDHNWRRVERCEFVVVKFAGGDVDQSSFAHLADSVGWKGGDPTATAQP